MDRAGRGARPSDRFGGGRCAGPRGLDSAVREREAELGPLDIVLANAGIAPLGLDGESVATFRDVIEFNLVAVYLVSDDGRYVSGVTLPVDAGLAAR